MKAEALVSILERSIDLSQPVFNGMPVFPNNPAFRFELTRPHGYRVIDGVSSAVETVTGSLHNASHLDALGHFSYQGRLYGGVPASDHQSSTRGLMSAGIGAAAVHAYRGVLLDIPALLGSDPLPLDYEITAEDLEAAATRQGVLITSGDAVLIRTGWGAFWKDPAEFPVLQAPGPGRAAARWLSARRIALAGSDTLSFEVMPNRSWSVHVHFLVTHGIYIAEALDLEGLVAAQCQTFVLLALPLNIPGATGSMIRPVALPIEEDDT